MFINFKTMWNVFVNTQKKIISDELYLNLLRKNLSNQKLVNHNITFSFWDLEKIGTNRFSLTMEIEHESLSLTSTIKDEELVEDYINELDLDEVILDIIHIIIKENIEKIEQLIEDVISY